MRLFVALLACWVCSCAGQKKSDRETRRDEIRSQAELKRQELAKVTGLFYGVFVAETGDESAASLQLEVKDIPKDVEGEIDPIIVPVLTGSIRFHLGSGAAAAEEDRVSFAITSADFDTENGAIELVSDNSTYASLLMGLSQEATGDLQGTWSLPSSSLNGGVVFSKAAEFGGSANLTDYLGAGLAGRYTGHADWLAAKRSQVAEFNMTVSDVPPDVIAVAGSLRLYFGDQNSSEYQTYAFADINVQPLTGRLTARSEGAGITLRGKVVGGCVVGDWTHKQSGQKGPIHVCQADSPQPKYARKEILSGVYQGELSEADPAHNLPPRVQLGLVANGVKTTGEGLQWSGDIRFYLGDFSGIEYFERQLTAIKYDPFTDAFSAKVIDDYNFSVVGTLRHDNFRGVLIQDGAGEIAKLDASRKEAE